MKARAASLPSRSYFKIEEIDKKYSIIRGKCLDIGSAPGGWTLYCAQKTHEKVYSLDLLPLNISDKFAKLFEKIEFLQGDYMENMNWIQSFAPYDVILSDMSPKTTGSKIVDINSQHKLVLDLFNLFDGILKEGGSAVFKIFSGEDVKELEDLLKSKFKYSKITRLKSSRSESFEFFAVLQGYKSNINTI